MGIFSRFEGKMEDTFEGAADHLANAPISPVQIAKKAEKQMRREKMLGAGKQYAPTLYTVLVNDEDDRRLFGYYPTLAGETETYLAAKAAEHGLVMDGQPLVRFIGDEGLKHGKFDVVAEMVAAPIIAQLRQEELQRYGLAGGPSSYGAPQNYNEPSPQPAQPVYDNGYNNSYDYYDAPQEANAANPYDMSGTAGDPYGAAGDPYAAAGADMGAAAAAGVATAGAHMGAAAAAPHTLVFGADHSAPAQAPTYPAMRARIIDEATHRPFDLTSSKASIGRESKNDITVHDPNASRAHAELVLSPQGIWILTDLNSTNGTSVNGRRISSQPLQDGDRITIGTTNLVFSQA